MTGTDGEQHRKGRAFRDLHEADGIFVMANAWDAGSAALLESAGFAAIATTSAGIAYSMGLPDAQGALTRDAHLEATRRIVAAVSAPVSVDAENGYGDAPEDVAETIRACAAAGAVGAGIEDYTGRRDDPYYDVSLAAERIRAAREAADGAGVPFTLTARAECVLYGHDEPFAEAVRRVNRYREAGADCLFVPGVKDPDAIGSLVREVDGPINVVMGLAGAALSVERLRELGVRRVSIGGSLQRATFGLVRRAAAEILGPGTFGYARDQIPDGELSAFFHERWRSR